jgi:hypothetical protein
LNKIVAVLLLFLEVDLLVLLMIRSSECLSVEVPALRVVAITKIRTVTAATEIISSHLSVVEGVAVVAAEPLARFESPDRPAAVS